MAYKINTKKCLKCGLCVKGCPAGAIVVDNKVKESDGLILYTTKIDAKKCTDCGTCVSFEWWCRPRLSAKPSLCRIDTQRKEILNYR